MAPIELKELNKYLEELFCKGFIWSSISILGTLKVFVKMKDGNMKLYINF